jgi:hypothetical protein
MVTKIVVINDPVVNAKSTEDDANLYPVYNLDILNVFFSVLDTDYLVLKGNSILTNTSNITCFLIKCLAESIRTPLCLKRGKSLITVSLT